jgi:hypothetical protein
VPPDKLINRIVRGLLAGLTRLGSRGGAHYFGRDFVSAEGQQLALVGQDTLGRAGLFEALVAIERPLALPDGLNGYLEHSDARAKGPPSTTLAALRGSAPPFEAISEAIAEGHRAAYAVNWTAVGVPESLSAAPTDDSSGVEVEDGWGESGVADIPIGFAEALVRLDGARLSGVRLRGDFLAPTFLIRELEASLAAAPLQFGALGARVDAAFHQAGAFILGLRDLRVFADAVLAAAELEAPPAPSLGAS